MKRLLFIILFAGALTSCKKEQVDPCDGLKEKCLNSFKHDVSTAPRPIDIVAISQKANGYINSMLSNGCDTTGMQQEMTAIIFP